ncbi:MAG: exodeoxyribonuclease V subunit gamma [Ignavibacteriaceae bacterium]|nr:exodeoxyribonuclease V subunit gamma [Ignavibacteriaceae bacterium]
MILTNQTEIKTDPKQRELELLAAGKAGDILYIVPTNRKARALRKAILDNSPGGSASGLQVTTLGTLCTNLFFRGNPEKDVVSEAVASVLLSQCFRELNPDYFSPYDDGVPKGTLDRIRNVINQYKRNGLTPHHIKKDAEELKGTEKRKALAIAAIYERYLSRFSELGVYDIGDIYENLINMSDDEFNDRVKEYAGSYEFAIADGFTDLTLPESRIIKRLFDSSGSPGYIYIDYNSNNESLFSSSGALIDQLTALGLSSHQEKTEYGRRFFQQKLAEGLFNYETVKKTAADQIRVIAAVNKREEAELIAKEIKELCAGGKYKPSDIALVINLIEDYSEIVRDVFDEYGVPLNLTDRYRVERNPLIISIMNLLELSENDYYYKNLFRALSGNIIGFDGLTINDLMMAASELKIVGGIKKWKNSLARMKSLPASGWEKLAVSAETCGRIEKALNKLEKLLSGIKGQHTFAGFRKEFYKLLSELRLEDKLLTGNIVEDETNVKAIKAFLRDMNATFSLLENEYGNERVFPLSYFINQLNTIISSSRYNLREKPNYGVLVTTPDEIRGLSFRVLFIGGLYEGNFPTKFSPEIFMAETYRKSEERHRKEEQFLFYQAASCFNEFLYLTAPSNDEKKKLVRSHFMDETLRIFAPETITRAKFEGAFYSPDEKQIYFGKLSASGETEGVDEETKTKILIDKARIEQSEGSPVYQGVIGEDAELKSAISQEAAERYFSISALEMYAACPFKYFTSRILNLSPVEEPVEKIEPLELGSLLHSILYDFIREVISSDTGYHTYLNDKYDEALERLIEIAKEKLAGVYIDETESFFDIEKIFGIGGNKRQSILALFLDEERKAAEFIPALVELEFRQEFDADERVIKLRGRIDRIDIDEADGLFKVIDYKLGGNKPTADDLKSGLSLQLPIYILAAKKALRELKGNEFRTVFPEIYSLKPGEIGGSKVSPEPVRGISDYKKSPENLEKAIEISENMASAALRMAMDYAVNIGNGEFHLTRLPNRAEKICKNCEHFMICRVRELD